MATRQVLAELADAYARACRLQVAIESVGGVDAARRVQAGEAFDVVGARLRRHRPAGRLGPRRRRQPGRPGALAGGDRGARRRAAARRGLGGGAAARRGDCTQHRLFHRAERHAPGRGCSSAGASPTRIRDRIVQPPPGVPVGSLVARGEVELGFQQLSELMHLEGIDVIGTLPAGCRRSSPPSRPACAHVPCAGRRGARPARLHDLARGRRGQAPPRHGAGLSARRTRGDRLDHRHPRPLHDRTQGAGDLAQRPDRRHRGPGDDADGPPT